jgi:hypothetical protein
MHLWLLRVAAALFLLPCRLTDKKFESHFRVSPPRLVNRVQRLDLPPDGLRCVLIRPSRQPRSGGQRGWSHGIRPSGRTRPGERPEHPVITNGSNRGPDEPAWLQAGWCKGRWVSRQFEMAQNTTDDGASQRFCHPRCCPCGRLP